MKIFTSEQIREIDEYTIKHEPVASVDLMERAAGQLFKWISERFGRSHRIIIFAGPGNNGGDGLALARMLADNKYDVDVYYVRFTDRISVDWDKNRQRLESEAQISLNYIEDTDEFPILSSDDIIVDAIFGSGLTRPVSGFPEEIIKEINLVGSLVISIDIPSGMFGEDNSDNLNASVIKADYTLSFHFPKLSFMFPDNFQYVGEWHLLSIGLNEKAIRNTFSPYSLIIKSDVSRLLKKRNPFDHKGNFGHGLLVAGSYGKMGAAILGARAALRTGIGLITCHIPSVGYTILQGSVPEAMVISDKSERFISSVGNTDFFNAVGIGPGFGTEEDSKKALYNLLTECTKPLVLDADALNILSMNNEWLSVLPEGTVITPHPKEFERLAGKSENGFVRMKKQLEFSARHKCIVLLKGAHTSITTPDGRVFFNNTGNPGMATAGSGDVLTGIILSLLAQNYSPEDAAVLGACLHGIAGDIAAEDSCVESIIASDIINCIDKAFNRIRVLEH